MFSGGDDVLVVDRWTMTLDGLDDGDAHARDEIRIFAVGFFGAAPTRVTPEIEVWTEHLLTTARACFQSGGSEHVVDQLEVPTRGERDRLRKTGAALGHVTVQDLVVEDSGNAEARVFDEPLLHGVGKLGAFARAFVFLLARDLADAVFHCGG